MGPMESPMSNRLLPVLLCALLMVLSGCNRSAGHAHRPLFVNLTSDAPDRAAMALTFAQRVREARGVPVTVFLNVEGVRLADIRQPSPVAADGRDVRLMLQGLIEAGGQVIICPMCMANVGAMTMDHVLAGVVQGGKDTTFPALLADDVQAISY